MNATWRSNLLPRSRFLELTVFKKMLAQGLHLTRHENGRAKPTTVFADREFRNLWWYKSMGMGVDSFNISSLLTVGTAVDPQSGARTARRRETAATRLLRWHGGGLITCFIAG